MGLITLLPKWSHPSQPELHLPDTALASGQLPDDWSPQPEGLRPHSFPSPYGVAESVAFVLQYKQFTNLYADRFRLLVEAALLGFFDASTVDLKHDADDFGRALLRVHGEREGFRYVVLLRDRSNRKVFGLSSPRCLFWPHARRNDEEWADLKHRVDRDTRLPLARELLADMRQSLQDHELWNPDEIPWMRGIDWIAGATRPSQGLSRLKNDSRSLTPLQVWAGGGKTAKQKEMRKEELFYWPVLEPGYGQRIVTLFRGQFRAENDGNISVLDARNEVAARIRIPRGREGANTLFIGAGIVEFVDNAATSFPSNTRPRLADDDQPGLFTVLQPVLRELERLTGVSRADVSARPLSFPDILRQALLLGDPSGGTPDVFSRTVNALVHGGGLEGYPSIDQLEASHDGLIVEAETGAKHVYVERWQESEVGDLRAVGAVLFQYFDGFASVYSDTRQILDSTSGEPLMEEGDDEFVEPCANMRKKVHDPHERTRLARRLATFQRFWKTYGRLDTSIPANRLAREAAAAFVRWVLEKEPTPLGTVATELELAPFGLLSLPLYLDAHARRSSR